MKDEVQKKLNDYLASRCHLTLATVTPEGKPLARTVTYCNDGAVLYFRADKNSRKVRDIIKNPTVAYTINDQGSDFDATEAVQMEGTATVLTGKEDLAEFQERLLAKFPQLAGRPTRPNRAIVRIEPTLGCFWCGGMEQLTF